ncbi:MAG: alkaline phosphatase D family protein [Actinomycetota bacterium]|nr:alkaline phosphatase D family protein [Actinomycetota bacterium]
MDRRNFLQGGVAATAAGLASVLFASRSAAAARTLIYADGFGRSELRGWGKAWFSPRQDAYWSMRLGQALYELPRPQHGAADFSPNPVLLLDHDVGDVEITAMFSMDNRRARVGICGRTSTYDDGYTAYFDGANIQISRYTLRGERKLAKASFVTTRGVIYMIRLRISGKNPVRLKAKAWRADAPEPRGWTTSVIDSAPDRVTGSGSTGFLFMHDKVYRRPLRVWAHAFRVTSLESPAITPPAMAFQFAGRTEAKADNKHRTLLVCRSNAPADSVDFQVSTDAGFSEYVTVPAQEHSADSCISKTWLDDLEPGRTVFWRTQAIRKDVVAFGPLRSFRTPPPSGSGISFAFGSCTNLWVSHNSFVQAAELDPDFYAHLGDFGYPATWNGSAMAARGDWYQDRWTRMLAAPEMGLVHDKASFVMMQDDHDYGGNNTWSQTVKPFSVTAWDEISGNDGARWFDLRYGDLHAFVTDTHVASDDPAAPDGPNHSCLGSRQKAWLKEAMAASDAPVLAVFSTRPFWGAGSGPGWKSSFAHEREELFAHFHSLQVPGRRIIALTGDAHAQFISRHPAPEQDGEPIYEFCSSGTDRGDTTTLGQPLGDSAGRLDPLRARKLAHAFGFVDIAEGGPGRLVRLRCISSETGTDLWPPLELPL